MAPTVVQAGAWVQPRGQGQAIVKYDRIRADEGYDPAGVVRGLPDERREASAGALVEYGLTEALTVQFKGNWQAGRDAFVDEEGRGPVELGLTWQAWRDPANAVGIHAGYAQGGRGRDWEARVSAGRSLGRAGAAWGLEAPFVEMQAARRLRGGLADETRIDATAGARFARDWMVLAQAYGGAADGGARWLSVEASLVRDLGRWSLQAGWRHTVAGRETAIARGPAAAIWRRF